jgi:hypothetical protein
MNTSQIIRENGLGHPVLSAANGYKRPEPTLRVTALLKDLFDNNRDKHYPFKTVVMIIRSKDSDISEKSIRSALYRLASPKGKNYLSVVNPYSRNMEYKLSKGSGTTQDAVTVTVMSKPSFNVAAVVQMQTQARVELEKLLSLRQEKLEELTSVDDKIREIRAILPA